MVGMAFAISTTATVILGQEVTYNGSLQFATGNYIFSERTNSVYLFSGLSVSTGRLQVSANIPVIMQSKPWVSYSGVGQIPSGDKQHEDGRGVTLPDTTQYDEIGLGDPLLHAGVEVLKAGKVFPSVHLVAEFKPPLANADRGFGTGEPDYGAGMSLAKAVGRNFAFVDITYWVLGDLPDLELKDPVAYSVAVGRPLANGKYSVLVSFSGYTEILNDVDPPAQVGIGLTYRLDSGPSLTGSLAFGVTDSNPDFSVAFGWDIGL